MSKKTDKVYQSKGMVKSVSMEHIDNRPAIVLTLQFNDYPEAEEYWSVLKDLQNKLEDKI
tara:strand:- start:190 stop:369 length:180 start_codon:yes stop_codon:yes gene_type:complete